MRGLLWWAVPLPRLRLPGEPVDEAAAGARRRGGHVGCRGGFRERGDTARLASDSFCTEAAAVSYRQFAELEVGADGAAITVGVSREPCPDP